MVWRRGHRGAPSLQCPRLWITGGRAAWFCDAGRMTWKQVAGRQNGAITLHQALEGGLTRAAIRSHLSSGRWQRLQHRVLLTHSGPVSDEAEAHGVLLAAGEDALLSHESTLWVWGIGQVPDQWTVLLPHDRRTRDVTGAEVVRTRAMPHGRSVNGYRTTSVQRAVVDIANRAGASVDDVIALVAKVCQKGLTNPERISKELASRRSHRMRDPMRLILRDVGEASRAWPSTSSSAASCTRTACRASRSRWSVVAAGRTSTMRSSRCVPRSTDSDSTRVGSAPTASGIGSRVPEGSSRCGPPGGTSWTSPVTWRRTLPTPCVSAAGPANLSRVRRPARSARECAPADVHTSRVRSSHRPGGSWERQWLLWRAWGTHEMNSAPPGVTAPVVAWRDVVSVAGGGAASGQSPVV